MRIRMGSCLLIVLLLAALALPAAAIDKTCPGNNGGAHDFSVNANECQLCHQTCDHAVSSYHDINHSYTDDDAHDPDMYHTRRWQDSAQICDACGFVIDPGEARLVSIPHVYYGDTCNVCGHVCTHSAYNTQRFECAYCNTPCPHAEYDTTTYKCKACTFPCPHAEYDTTTYKCKACGFPCAHTVSSYHDINYSCTDDYTVNPDELHTQHWQDDAQICDACGFVIDPGEAKSGPFLHSYTDGQCHECNHVCTHPTYNTQTFECAYCNTPCPHAEYDTTTYKCKACTSPCPHAEYDTTTYKCKVCGFPCDHAVWSYDDINYTYTDDDTYDPNERHIMRWQNDAQICDACGFVIDPGEARWVSFLHAYYGDTCDECGHVCTHPDYDTSNYRCTYCYTPCPHVEYDTTTHLCKVCIFPCPHAKYDTTTHLCKACTSPCPHAEYDAATYQCKVCTFLCPHAEYDTTTYKCKACGFPCAHTVSSYHDINFSFTDDSPAYPDEVHTHRWQDDAQICDACGFVIDPGIPSSSFDGHGYIHDECIYCHHICTHSTYNTQSFECLYCRTPCPHAEYDATTHRCKVCTFPCDHPSGSIRERDQFVRYVDGAGKERTHDAVYVKVKYCSACSAVTETGTNEVTETEPHSFVSGVCEACLYVCRHADYDTATYRCSYCDTPCPHAAYDKTTRQCAACGFPCPHAAYDAATRQCAACGFPCPHPTGKIVLRQGNIRFEEISNNGVLDDIDHVKYWTPYESCDQCGMLVATHAEEFISEPHAFDANGTCSLCRHDCTHSEYDTATYLCVYCGAPCPHTGARAEDTDHQYTLLSETQHTHAYTAGAVTCPDCLKALDAGAPTSAAEAHAFGANGTCALCGFGCAHDRFIRVKNAGGGYDVTCEMCGMICPHTDKTKKTDIRYTPAVDAHVKSVSIARSCAVCRYVTSVEKAELSEPHAFEPDIAGRNRCALCRQYEDAPLDGDGTFLPNADMRVADGAESAAPETGDAYDRWRVDIGACEDEYQFAVYELPGELKGRALLAQPPEGACAIASSGESLFIVRRGGDATFFYISGDAAAEQHGYRPVGEAPIGDDVLMKGDFSVY